VPAPALSILPAEEQDFGRYKLLCRFATGGMANIYLARLEGSVGFEKFVAIKRIHDHLGDNEEFIQMFVDEARLCARITHPNVAQVIELGTIGGSHFIAMEYVEGEPLSAVMRRTRPPLTHCARIIASAAAGLHAAHELRDQKGLLINVVHRDVSPQNILVAYDGSVKLVDFGVARARTNLHTTTAGQVKGKYAYMAPEQIAIEPVIDRRTDVFALGVVLYEISTAHRLFKSTSDAATIAKVQEMNIPPPSRVMKDYPAGLESIVLKALSREKEDRFQTADEMEDALEDYLVTTGVHTTHRQIGQLMRETFADRIKLKQDMLVSCETSTQVFTAPDGASGTNPSMSLHGRSISQARREIELEQMEENLRKRRKAYYIAGLAVVFVVALVIVLWAVLRAGGSEQPPVEAKVPAPEVPAKQPVAPPTAPKPEVKPQQIKIKIAARPANAEIVVDGKKVKNPFLLQRFAGKGKLLVEIRGTGLVSRRFQAPLQESNSWMIELQRVAQPKPQPVPRVKPKVRPTGKRPAGRRPSGQDDDLFGDPY
jgi:serine/threonine protein kinase